MTLGVLLERVALLVPIELGAPLVDSLAQRQVSGVEYRLACGHAWRDLRRHAGTEGGRRVVRAASSGEGCAGRRERGPHARPSGALDSRRRQPRRPRRFRRRVLRPSERRFPRRRHHRHERQDDDQLPDGGHLRRGRRPLRPCRHRVLRHRGRRACRAPDDARGERSPAHAARDGVQRLRRVRRRDSRRTPSCSSVPTSSGSPPGCSPT